jgi:DNA invertase Pin-like site-specific DNA recombinase
MVRGQKNFVAYYRVSVDKRPKDGEHERERGLGMQAQVDAVEAFVRFHDGRICAKFEETESGKRDDRPELAKALARTRALKATLLIAKLDRLSRDTLFLLTLQKAGVDFVAVDMPDANNFTIGIMALMAQHEREAISSRTKAALEVAREKVAITGQISGLIKRPEVKRLGNPKGAPHWQGERAWRKAAQVAAIKAKSEKAVKRALDLAPILKELEAERIISANAKAAALNERHVPTALGKRWTARSVINVQERIKEFSKQ